MLSVESWLLNVFFSRKRGGCQNANARRCAAFTLFELMIVVGILGIIAAIGIPSIARTMQKEGMRKAVSDFTEACSDARAKAILGGQNATLTIHPLEGTFEATGGKSGQLPDNVRIELMGVNFVELQDAEQAVVHFFPNGTCDEFAMLLRSDENEVRKITLDIITGLTDVEDVR